MRVKLEKRLIYCALYYQNKDAKLQSPKLNGTKLMQLSKAKYLKMIQDTKLHLKPNIEEYESKRQVLHMIAQRLEEYKQVMVGNRMRRSILSESLDRSAISSN